MKIYFYDVNFYKVVYISFFYLRIDYIIIKNDMCRNFFFYYNRDNDCFACNQSLSARKSVPLS